MEKTILVKSSSRDEPYAVVVSLTESGLSFYCNCPAGQFGKYCKHKMAIILTDEKILYDEEQVDNFKKIAGWTTKSVYPNLVKDLQRYEKELEEAKKNVKNKKEMIARIMNEGKK